MRLITPLFRSDASVVPPKISRFIITYITRFPGREKLKPEGTGCRPAKLAFNFTGFGMAITSRSAASVSGSLELLPVLTSKICPFMAIKARNSRS